MDPPLSLLVADRYRLVARIGQGMTGELWLAQDRLLGNQCALKFMAGGKTAELEARVRFLYDARTMARLRGPHVVNVFDSGSFDGTPYVAMEYLRGGSLRVRLCNQGPLVAEATHRLIVHVARALEHAHSLGIVHGNLSPENVFLVETDDGEVAKVLGFGSKSHVARALFSPEQARGQSPDRLLDLWALAFIAFECLTGRSPTIPGTPRDLLAGAARGRLVRHSHAIRELPAPFAEFWDRATAFDSRSRYQSVAELADALGIVLSATDRPRSDPASFCHVGSSPPQASPPTASFQSDAPVQLSIAPPPPVSSRPMRRPLLFGLGWTLVGVAVATVWFSIRPASTPPLVPSASTTRVQTSQVPTLDPGDHLGEPISAATSNPVVLPAPTGAPSAAATSDAGAPAYRRSAPRPPPAKRSGPKTRDYGI